MASVVTVHRPDDSKPMAWVAECEEHKIGLKSSKPSCLNWAEEHIRTQHDALTGLLVQQ